MTLKSLIHWHQSRPKLAVGSHVGITIFLLGFALVSQYFFGFAPCELCIWQRIPYGIIAAMSAIALLLNRKWSPVFLGLIAVLYLVEAGLAFYHIGVQAGWFLSGCGFQSTAGDIKALYEQIKSAPLARCNEVSWRFVGFSMPEWNFVIALSLAVMSAAQAWIQKIWLFTPKVK